MEQRNLFDAKASAEARDESIEKADRAARHDWAKAAEDAVRKLARRRAEFTTDDVWKLLEAYTGPTTHEPRALGAVMRRASGDGLIKATDRTALSTRVACHRRPVRVWRSLIL